MAARGSSLTLLLAALGLLLALAHSPDPSGSWLSYVKFDAKGKRITAMNLTTIIPADPRRVGADPSFW